MNKPREIGITILNMVKVLQSKLENEKLAKQREEMATKCKHSTIEMRGKKEENKEENMIAETKQNLAEGDLKHGMERRESVKSKGELYKFDLQRFIRFS